LRFYIDGNDIEILYRNLDDNIYIVKINLIRNII